MDLSKKHLASLFNELDRIKKENNWRICMKNSPFVGIYTEYGINFSLFYRIIQMFRTSDFETVFMDLVPCTTGYEMQITADNNISQIEYSLPLSKITDRAPRLKVFE